MRVVELEIPEVFQPLLEPHRYKVLYGGRASTKSWTIARVLLTLALRKKLRILCAREIQNSIQESVHQLLSSQIELLGYQDRYEIQKTVIYGRNGTEFFFSGLKHKIESLKSAEGIDICWVEEAQTTSKTSWDKLSPTIRKPGSEIWISFNPELDTDETYQRFVLNPPPSAWVKHVSYRDNPWFGQEMIDEMRATRARSEDDFQNIWLGHTKQVLEGAIYAKELRAAQADERITRVPYDQAHPVNTYWDLGHHDLTAIWFIQRVGFEYHIIDYYENQQELLPHYVKVLQDRGYTYGVDYMPHDANSHSGLGSTVAERFKELTGRRPNVLPRDNVANGIDALRTMFPRLWFDEERCADGLNALRRYCYKVDPDTKQFSRVPDHSMASHASDALRYFAMSTTVNPTHRPVLQLVKPEVRRPQLRLTGAGRAKTAWMGV